MSFTVKLQYNHSPNNKLDKNIQDVLTVSGTLKDSTSLIDPVIIIECDLTDVRKTNYCTIDAFGRKYFIINITSVRKGLVEFECHVDVLTTYKDDIRDASGIVRKQENKFNLLLNDSSLAYQANPIIRAREFPHGFNNDGEFVLAVAGR